MKLRTRFAFSFIGYTFLVLAFFAGTYYFLERREAMAAQEDAEIQGVEKLVSACRETALDLNAIIALNYINIIKKEPAIALAACLDLSGRVQAHSDARLIGRQLKGPEYQASDATIKQLASSRGGPPTIEWRAPVRVEGNKVGLALLAYNRDVLAREIHQKLLKMLKQLMAIASLAFGLAVLIGLVLAANLSRPIGSLVEAARAIGSGRLEFRTPIKDRADELGTLAQEINLMAGHLAELDELKEEFVHSVSHDLRNPMGAIKMYVEFMLHMDPERNNLTPRHREWLATIMDCAVRLDIYVTNILDTAKLKAGQMEFNLQPVSLDGIARNTQKLFQMVAQKQQITLEILIPPDLPKMRADPVRMDQVLSNLVSNALKFTPPGGKVSIQARRAGETVETSVIDTGSGMSKQDLVRLFRKFEQLDSKSQNNAAGAKSTGLGLFITKQTVSAMGGKIAVESEPGKGSAFKVILPIAKGG